jgi:hypothetical protein
MPCYDVLREHDVHRTTVPRVWRGGLIRHDSDPKARHEVLARLARDKRVAGCIRGINDLFVQGAQLPRVSVTKNNLAAHIFFVVLKVAHSIYDRHRQTRGVAVVENNREIRFFVWLQRQISLNEVHYPRRALRRVFIRVIAASVGGNRALMQRVVTDDISKPQQLSAIAMPSQGHLGIVWMPKLLLQFAEKQPGITKTDTGGPDQNVQEFSDSPGLSDDSSQSEGMPRRHNRRGPTAIDGDRPKFKEGPKQTLSSPISFRVAANGL